MIVASEQPSVIIPAIPDLLWGSIAFLIVAFAVYKLAWPSFMKMLDERGEKIDKGLRAAEEARADVAAERARMEQERQDASREAAEIRARAKENAKSIVARAEADARSEAQRIAEASQRQIAADRESAQRSLQTSMGAIATDLAAKIVGGQVAFDPKVSESVVDQFLDELESQGAGDRK